MRARASRTPRCGCAWRVALVLASVLLGCGGHDASPRAERPNFLWIVADDMGFEIGAYGDSLARTPTLDRLASEGVRYTHAFATAGVCAPSRAALFTGMFATSIGAHHMRSIQGGYEPVPPPEVKTFTEYLRAAGYYTSSVGKLDYQFSGLADGAPITNWDQPNGDWRGRELGQPFFAHVTILDTHESQLFATGETETDPGAVAVPPYYPDTAVVRQDLARHYDNVARLDEKVGRVLEMLEEDGVAENTVVFFFPDNGRGFPRDKRWVYDGGIHAPLLVRWPRGLAPGAVQEELVSYVDFAPTVLALAGVPVPSYLPGRVFLGPGAGPEPDYVFAAEDRHDEATDRIRAVRDRRFKYIRNHQPETPYGQSIAFRNLLATMQEIFRLHDEGRLLPPADWYYRPAKPVEELYDTSSDPFELENLAGRPEHAARLEAMRAAHDRWVIDTNDLGSIPEPELAELFWPGGVQPVTPPPTIEPGGGSFAGSVEVEIHSDVAGASIAYTLEQGASARWKLYSGSFPLTAPGTLRARAVRYGWAESTDTTAQFQASARVE
jgi:N-sulfoglucosamine sulfohydrolase